MKKLGYQPFERELFKLSDGGTIAIDWANAKPNKEYNRPLLIVIPGLTGDN